jgi:hypothetical protein
MLGDDRRVHLVAHAEDRQEDAHIDAVGIHLEQQPIASARDETSV